MLRHPRSHRIKVQTVHDSSLRRVSLGRITLLTAVFCLLAGLVSLVASLAQQSGTPLTINAVEWLRDNGAREIVTRVEDLYYTLEAPAKGGPALHRLPGQAGHALAGAGAAPGAGARHGAGARPNAGARRGARPGTGVRPGAGRAPATPAYYRPAAITPLIAPALPGEGSWRATFSERGLKHPPVLITSFRSDPSYPRMVAGVAWIDQNETSTWLYAGLREPDTYIPNRGSGEIPPADRARVVAAFNSGFKLIDSGGGVALDGRTDAPLKDGIGTFVRYRDGRVDVIDWRGGARVGPDIVYARQNLPLLVTGARPNPEIADARLWGFTLGNDVRVWRSAVGVDRRGNLIYAAADDQTAGSLAAIMIHAGAVRAMELDINAEWPSFITYRGPSAADPANLLPDMQRSPRRYLVPDDRDFFAVYLRPTALRQSGGRSTAPRQTGGARAGR